MDKDKNKTESIFINYDKIKTDVYIYNYETCDICNKIYDKNNKIKYIKNKWICRACFYRI